jgi:hypothetical protein
MIIESTNLIFWTDEEVKISVVADQAQSLIQWKVIDYFGIIVSQGSAQAIMGKATIQPVVEVGYYELELTDNNSTIKTSFALLTPVTTTPTSAFGVHTHFAQFHDLEIIPLLAKLGISHIRDEQYWSWLEQQQGTYEYPQKYLDYMAGAQSNNIEPLICLTWSNPFYDYDGGDFTLPYSAEGKQGYNNYVKEVVNHYNGQIKAVEIWNEVNAGTFITGPATQNKPFYYSELLKSVYPAIKSVDSSVKVLAGATVPIAHGFFKQLFEYGAMPYCDVISVHPYGLLDDAKTQFAGLYDIIKSHNNNNLKPVWVTEFGYNVSSEEDRKNGAPYIAQVSILMLSEGVERLYYYHAQDDGSFPFQGFLGSSSNNFKPNPVSIAYATLIRQLGDVVYQSRFNTSSSIYAFKFSNNNKQVTVVWSKVLVKLGLVTSSQLTIFNLVGSPSIRNPVSDIVELNIDGNVQYIEGAVSNIIEIDNPVIADSETGYTNVQGDFGWYYGYMDATPETYHPDLFQPMTWGIWGTDNYRYLGPDSFGGGNFLHPSHIYWAIRRWVSNYAGNVVLSGKLSRGWGGNGVMIRIFVDGILIHTQDLLAEEQSQYNVKTNVQVGSIVDYTIDSKDGDSNFDATVITSLVTKDGESGPPKLLQAVSRRVHGNKGAFDIPISIDDKSIPPIECRNGTNFTVVMFFDKEIVSAKVFPTARTGKKVELNGPPIFNGKEIIVKLKNVSDQQLFRLTIKEIKAIDNTSLSSCVIRARVLIGDVTGDNWVSNNDKTAVINNMGQPTNSLNFRCDLNSTGNITDNDIVVVTKRLGNIAPKT